MGLPLRLCNRFLRLLSVRREFLSLVSPGGPDFLYRQSLLRYCFRIYSVAPPGTSPTLLSPRYGYQGFMPRLTLLKSTSGIEKPLLRTVFFRPLDSNCDGCRLRIPSPNRTVPPSFLFYASAAPFAFPPSADALTPYPFGERGEEEAPPAPHRMRVLPCEAGFPLLVWRCRARSIFFFVRRIAEH